MTITPYEQVGHILRALRGLEKAEAQTLANVRARYELRRKALTTGLPPAVLELLEAAIKAQEAP